MNQWPSFSFEMISLYVFDTVSMSLSLALNVAFFKTKAYVGRAEVTYVLSLIIHRGP